LKVRAKLTLTFLLTVLLLSSIFPAQEIIQQQNTIEKQNETVNEYQVEITGLHNRKFTFQLTNKQSQNLDQELKRLSDQILNSTSRLEASNFLKKAMVTLADYGIFKSKNEAINYYNGLCKIQKNLSSHSFFNKGVYFPEDGGYFNILSLVAGRFEYCHNLNPLFIFSLILWHYYPSDASFLVLWIINYLITHNPITINGAFISQGDYGASQKNWVASIGLLGIKSTRNYGELVCNFFIGIKIVQLYKESEYLMHFPGYFFGFCLYSHF